MCVGEECGRYRIYSFSEMNAKQMWLGNDAAIPADPADILPFPRGLTNPAHESDAMRHFRDGLAKKWRKPVHVGAKCPGDCRCVKTDEKVGGASDLETRVWRQRVEIDSVQYVISGTYALKFQDYRATCDDDDEEGGFAGPDEQRLEFERQSI